MKRSILPLLCCPVCKGELTVHVDKGNDREIINGTLHCHSCCVNYPIEDGIPDLLPRISSK
jgi:uncharacterized protein YbaR (Trm112 family)